MYLVPWPGLFTEVWGHLCDVSGQENDLIQVLLLLATACVRHHNRHLLTFRFYLFIQFLSESLAQKLIMDAVFKLNLKSLNQINFSALSYAAKSKHSLWS